MSSVAPPRPQTLSWILSALIVGGVAAGDQATKALVVRRIPEHVVIPVWPGFFNLIHTTNPGVAFGVFSESPAPWKTMLLIVVSAGLLVTVVAMLWRAHNVRWLTSVGLALILGGALSNLLDRIRFGQVVDFLDFYYRSYHWATFNVADSAIVIGAGFLIVQVIFCD
jgi:signal peptidase II